MKNQIPMDEKLLQIFNRFNADGNVMDIVPFGNGLINKTYLVKTDKKNYMLQSINSYVFRNADNLMRNVYIVTRHLSEKNVTTLCFCKTINHKIYVNDNGEYYRLYTFIENSHCYEKLTDLALIEKAGKAFGDFHAKLSDLDPILLAEIIPDFHNTPKRYETLLKSVRKDEVNRASSCIEELEFIKSQRNLFFTITEKLDSGELPERIAHNDPKINNILFDEESSNVKCVIDLDTVMPGSVLFDYGDALRSLFTGDNESALSSDELIYNKEIFKAYTLGYLSGMKDELTQTEKELLPCAVFTLTIELAIRFLTDYIDGDKYFRTTFPDENLVRARNQIHLAKSILNHMDGMKKIVEEI